MGLLSLRAALWGCTYANIDHAFRLNLACTLNKSQPQRTPEAERNFISFVRYLVTDWSTGGNRAKQRREEPHWERERGGKKKAARCKSQRREPPPLAQSDLHSGLEQVHGGTLIICSRPANASVFESFLCSLTKKVRTGNKSVKPEERVCCGTFLLNQTEAPGGEQGGLSEMTSNIGGNKRNAKTSFSSLDENFCMKQFSSEWFSSKFPSSFKKKQNTFPVGRMQKCEPSHWMPKTHKCL